MHLHASWKGLLKKSAFKGLYFLGATPTRVFAFGRVLVTRIKTRPKPKGLRKSFVLQEWAVGVAPGGWDGTFLLKA
jgi:hypothetical protein